MSMPHSTIEIMYNMISMHSTQYTHRIAWWRHNYNLGVDDSANGQRKRLQRVEILKIAEPCPLIDPSQVVVTQGEILVADPVLTPIGEYLFATKRASLSVLHSLSYFCMNFWVSLCNGIIWIGWFFGFGLVKNSFLRIAVANLKMLYDF